MKKLNLLYDATIVCSIMSKNASRSGIFFAAYNVLLQLIKNEDFNVYLHAADTEKLKNVINNCPEFCGCKIFHMSPVDKLICSIYDNRNLMPYLRKFLLQVCKLLNKYLPQNPELNDIDIYFSPMKAPPKYILANKKIKRYTILHDAIPLINDYRENVTHGWFDKLVKSINLDDKYFANSVNTKQDFIKYVPAVNPDNIIVIPLSTGKPYKKINDKTYIDQIKHKYKIPLDKKYILSLCNLDPRKNLIFSIKNFLNFIGKNSLDDFIFVLGGAKFKDFENILNENIENLCEKKDKILRIGYIDDEDMSALYSGAEMFVFPSLYEGFGIPVLEAMQCGLPVICSNTSSLPEVVGDCGIQIDPHSDKELIEAMEKMYFDRNFRENCITKGFKRAGLFSWEKCGRIIASVIKKDFNL